MDTISNANQAGGVAYLQFNNKPDGRFEARYQLMGLMEGLVVPTFLKDHFQLNDFTPFHDEIRKVSDDFLVGQVHDAAARRAAAAVRKLVAGPVPYRSRRPVRLLLHADALRTGLPTNTLLRPFLDVQLPDGVGMTFDEQMDGWYFPGQGTPAPGREGDLTIGDAHSCFRRPGRRGGVQVRSAA